MEQAVKEPVFHLASSTLHFTSITCRIANMDAVQGSCSVCQIHGILSERCGLGSPTTQSGLSDRQLKEVLSAILLLSIYLHEAKELGHFPRMPRSGLGHITTEQYNLLMSVLIQMQIDNWASCGCCQRLQPSRESPAQQACIAWACPCIPGDGKRFKCGAGTRMPLSRSFADGIKKRVLRL